MTVFGEFDEELFPSDDQSRFVGNNFFIIFLLFVWLILFIVDFFDREDSISLGQAIQDSWIKRKS